MKRDPKKPKRKYQRRKITQRRYKKGASPRYTFVRSYRVRLPETTYLVLENIRMSERRSGDVIAASIIMLGLSVYRRLQGDPRISKYLVEMGCRKAASRYVLEDIEMLAAMADASNVEKDEWFRRYEEYASRRRGEE